MKRLVKIILCISLFIFALAGCGPISNLNADNKGSSNERKDAKDTEAADTQKNLKTGAKKTENGTDNIKNKDIKDTNKKDATEPESYDLEKIRDGFSEGSLEFAFNIFKELNEEDPQANVFISPLSISQVLAMAYNGAETGTKEAMEKVMGYSGLKRSDVNESFSNLNSYLGQIDKKIELETGNSIWIRNEYMVKNDFLETNQTNFRANVDILDFKDPSAADIINDWISKATKGKIDRMLEPPIPKDAVMYIVNAIYFKGEWSTRFDHELTYKDDFTALDGRVHKVYMMTRAENTIEYTKNDEFQAVRLPYGDGKVSMYIILPRKGININDFIDNMDTGKWNGIRKTVSENSDIVFAIPKFKLEYGIKNLNNCLTKLGMGEVFDDNADFSGIGENIRISNILHKALIEVNEAGSEAAAATIAEVDEAAYSEPDRFIVDRPFMFIINDDVTGTILFMGKAVSIGE